MSTRAHRSTWPFFRTPLRIYLIVMLPICVLEVFLLLNDFPRWMQISSGAVIVLTVYGFVRGYVRRLILTEEQVEMRGLFFRAQMSWAQVRSLGVYLPGGGLGATEYFFITCEEAPPAGPWQINARTFQVQARDDLHPIARKLHEAATKSMS